MKKAVLLMVLAGCITGVAFAQLRMNGWGRAVWVPVYNNGDDWKTVTQSSYGDLPDLEFMFSASSENIGIDLGMIVYPGNPGQIQQIANAKVWWKPNNFFKLHIGSGRVVTLRGQVAGSTGGYYYANGRLTGVIAANGVGEPIVQINDGDGIFSRFNLAKLGAIMEITPLPGLFLGAAFAPNRNPGLMAEDVYKGLHVAAGYEINNIGLVRVGYVGGGKDGAESIGNASENWDFSWDQRIEAAFALKAVQGFLFDVGVKYSFEDHPGILDQGGFTLENPLYLALGMMYTGVPKLSLGFAMDGHFAGKADVADGDAVTSAPQIAFNIYPTYDIGFCFLGADITYGMQFGDVEAVNDKKMLGFGLHAQKQYGHGNVRAGLALNVPMEEGEKLGFSFPVWITYSF
jgi:hypothetical protein